MALRSNAAQYREGTLVITCSDQEQAPGRFSGGMNSRIDR